MAFLLIAATCIKITLLKLRSEHPHKRRLFIYSQNMLEPRSSADLLVQNYETSAIEQTWRKRKIKKKPALRNASRHKLQENTHNGPQIKTTVFLFLRERLTH